MVCLGEERERLLVVLLLLLLHVLLLLQVLLHLQMVLVHVFHPRPDQVSHKGRHRIRVRR